MLLTAMSMNLGSDGLPGVESDSPTAWRHRKDVCVGVIQKYAPLVVCTQQGRKSQMEDLELGLPGYEQFGKSRSGPGDPADVHCSILYDRDRVERMDGGTFWLSDSPSTPGSKAWGSKLPSIVTWVVLNTQLSCSSSRARMRGAFLAWQHIQTLPPTLPVIFCGDFNADKASRPGRFLLGFSRHNGLVGDMRDAWAAASHRQNSHLYYTHHGFQGTERGALEVLRSLFRITFLCWERANQDLHRDWILFRGRTLNPVHVEVVDDHVDNRYPSDHFPIYVQFLLPRTVRTIS